MATINRTSATDAFKLLFAKRRCECCSRLLQPADAVPGALRILLLTDARIARSPVCTRPLSAADWPGLIMNLVIYTLLNWTGNMAIVFYGPQVGGC